MTEHDEVRTTPPPVSRRRRLLLGAAVMTTVVSAGIAIATFDASAAPTPSASPGASAGPAGATDPAAGSGLPGPATGVGDDPLTAAEVDKARAVAVTPQLAASAEDVTGAKGPEYLSSEILVEGTGRDAAFYFYDYHTDELIKQIVDVATGKVTGSFRAKGMQPPASDAEVTTALNLMLAAPVGADVRKLYTDVTGKPWTGVDQLKVEAHTFTARPADTDAASRKCGQNRCVQLVARVVDGPFVDLNDIIINLSERTVARVR